MAALEWSEERALQFLGTMEVLLGPLREDPTDKYPTVVRQTAECLKIVGEDKKQQVLNAFSAPVRRAILSARLGGLLRLGLDGGASPEVKSPVAGGALGVAGGIEGTSQAAGLVKSPKWKKAPHWIQFVDEEQGVAYYEDLSTGRVTWDRPASDIKVDGYDFLNWEEDVFTQEDFENATERAFAMVDKDHDGKVSMDDVKKFLEETHHEDQLQKVKENLSRLSTLAGFRAYWNNLIVKAGSERAAQVFFEEFGFHISSGAWGGDDADDDGDEKMGGA